MGFYAAMTIRFFLFSLIGVEGIAWGLGFLASVLLNAAGQDMRFSISHALVGLSRVFRGI